MRDRNRARQWHRDHEAKRHDTAGSHTLFTDVFGWPRALSDCMRSRPRDCIRLKAGTFDEQCLPTSRDPKARVDCDFSGHTHDELTEDNS